EQLGAVEEVINIGERYKGIVIVKVISAEKHPNADKLKVCWVDDSKTVKDVPRDKNGHVEIVCGAPNVEAGQLVAWIPPGSTVPSTFDKDPFVIESREIRGVISNGMLASPKELALGDSHEGLLIIDQPAKPGQLFASTYGLDDYIVDIENKMFTHRPDLFGQLGIARELAGIQGHSFKSPPWYKEDVAIPNSNAQNSHKLVIKNDVPELLPRFCALVVKDVKVGPSPVWANVRLSSVGVRPINNIVDVTNYLMLESAQPLHAYDYDKVRTGILGARLSKKGEKLNLLNGKQLTLDDGDVVITDGERAIGLAGIMGGADTEVDENTKNIILECANFEMNQTRKAAMKYGIFTDASTRFTKNQSSRQNQAAIARAADEIMKLAGGRISGGLVDEYTSPQKSITVKIDAKFINSRLGLSLSANQIKKLLENVEFKVKAANESLEITSPFWRTDIEIPEDIVEEVGRLYGYDKLPQSLPTRAIEPVAKNELLEMKNQIRDILSAFGANEALTYSFVHRNLLKKAGQDERLAYKLTNALSPNLQYYRFNLLPSLLDKVHGNIKAGFDKFALFEIGKGHDHEHKDTESLPEEFELLSLIYTASSKTNPEGAAYFQAKHFLDNLAVEVGIKLEYKTTDKLPDAPLAQAYDAARTAMVSTDTGKFLGIIGEFKSSVRQSLKLPEQTAGFEIDIEALTEAKPKTTSYQLLDRFPQTHQDLCLRTKTDLSYAELTSFVGGLLRKSSVENGYITSIEPLDIFQREEDKQHKQTTWRITLSHPRRTLTTDEVNKLLDQIAEKAKSKYQAERI
ncbi:phenylalanine--tRNA ligase subunit beta, partial [Candidatus Saccharibacteria bacterium]|nr:phenylalanine--tRNA ligase subunit beta [Candidatus Saccharibacteria bacterium]